MIRLTFVWKFGMMFPAESLAGRVPAMTGSAKNTNPVEDWELPPVRVDV